MIHRFIYVLIVLSLNFTAAFSQLNVELVGQLQYDHMTNDIWGYADTAGNEYALVGTVQGFSIVDLADPANPVEVDFIEGSTNTWRDIKSWDHYAYVSTEAHDGILIADLNTIPNDTVTYHFVKPEFPELGQLRKAHNIYIDERGLLYVSGSNLNNGGVIVLDLNNDPYNPEPLGVASAPYSHDAYARNGILYSSEIYAGNLALYQVDLPFASTLVGQTSTPREFTHNAWPSDNDSVVFTTDEVSNAWVAAYDISDYDNISELDRFLPAATVGEGVIPHNVHVFNDYLVISYYTDGCIIVDASRPDNLIEVGNYDSYLGNQGGYNGVWGAYPFLPSGRVLITDRSNGLFILDPTYVRGCYLEGFVKDSVSLAPIFQASVEILADEAVLPELSKPDGSFKTGKGIPGTYEVTVSAPGYFPKTIEVDFENGILVEKEILLRPIPRHAVNGIVISTLLEGPAPDANLILTDGFFTYETISGVDGSYQVPEVLEGTYDVYAGVWGEFFIGTIDVFASGAQNITLVPGYYDDFTFDYNWEVSGTSIEAMWEREIPQGQTLFNFIPCGPTEDIQEDFGEFAYITGNEGKAAELNDVDLGYTLLSSPSMDLRKYTDPVLSYRPWLCQYFDGTVNYTVLLSNGQDTITIDTIVRDEVAGYWREAKEIYLREFLELTDDVQVHFLAQDTLIGAEENVVKAGLDVFSITGEVTTSTATPGENSSAILAYPNPFSSRITVKIEGFDLFESPQFQLIDLVGQVIKTGQINDAVFHIDLQNNLPDGIYFLRIIDHASAGKTVKLIKQF